ncbi:MAG TPA: Rid family detoxifying hydrolase [Candidatus Saccharimonadales bacterium]|nr:Rid family detoxifying hydrolase [Candidatus Saccharimonadales bacterium]
MVREFVRTANAPQPAGPYSQAIKAGPFVFVAAQGPVDPKTGKMADDVESQTRQTLLNIKAILEASGSTMADVVKVSVFLKNAGDFSKMNDVYKTFFSQNPPTRTTVEAKFAGPMLVEIDAIAFHD